MAHYATRKFNYTGQLGILVGLCGGGIILGTIAMLIPFLGSNIDVFSLEGGNTEALMDKVMSLPNATSILRWSQALATPFIFCLPPMLYAYICHVKPMKHFGFDRTVTIQQALVVILIMIACMPAVAVLQQLTEMLPWSKSMLQKFKEAEVSYSQMVTTMAKMNTLGDYFISLFIIALLPAVFEELMFRGAWQNLLSRWLKNPMLALIIVSIIFSAIHGSYLGFLSRFALGFVLGWMYYRTGNIWLNIIGHFFNNAAAVTQLYWLSKKGNIADLSKMEQHFPLWVGLISVAAVVGLFFLFEKINKKQIEKPGRESIMPGYINNNNPFDNDVANFSNANQSYN